MVINNEKLMELQGMKFDSINDALNYLTRQLDDLLRHNKNYTQSQYLKLDTINDIIKCITEV